MANLANVKECARFIAAWRAHFKNRPELFQKRMSSIAEEQRRILQANQSAGRDVGEYQRAVRMLESAANGSMASHATVEDQAGPRAPSENRTVYQPMLEHMPESMASFECYRSLAVAHADHPEIPAGAWLVLSESDIEDPLILDEDLPPSDPKGDAHVALPVDREELADAAFIDHDFGAGVQVLYHRPWAIDHDGALLKTAFLELPGDGPDDDLHKITFRVRFDASGAVVDAQSMDSAGKVVAADPLSGWMARVNASIAILGDTPLQFNTWLQQDKALTARNGTLVTVVEPVLAPSDELDEQVLPFMRVRDASGDVFLAEPDELSSTDPRWVECFNAVCAGFAVARRVGDYDGPHHLAQEGTAEHIATFVRGVETFTVESWDPAINQWSAPAPKL